MSRNPALEVLYCEYNLLTSLDVSKNTALRTMWCGNNQLTSLDVSKNPALGHLVCTSNRFTAAGLNALFGTLNSMAGGSIFINKNPGTAGCDKTIATKKGWKVTDTED